MAIHTNFLDPDLGFEMQVRIHAQPGRGVEHVNEARSLMVQLVEEASFNSIPSMRRQHVLRDGTVIEVTLSHGVQVVDIWPVEEGEEENLGTFTVIPWIDYRGDGKEHPQAVISITKDDDGTFSEPELRLDNSIKAGHVYFQTLEDDVVNADGEEEIPVFSTRSYDWLHSSEHFWQRYSKGTEWDSLYANGSRVFVPEENTIVAGAAFIPLINRYCIVTNTIEYRGPPYLVKFYIYSGSFEELDSPITVNSLKLIETVVLPDEIADPLGRYDFRARGHSPCTFNADGTSAHMLVGYGNGEKSESYKFTFKLDEEHKTFSVSSEKISSTINVARHDSCADPGSSYTTVWSGTETQYEDYSEVEGMKKDGSIASFVVADRRESWVSKVSGSDWYSYDYDVAATFHRAFKLGNVEELHSDWEVSGVKNGGLIERWSGKRVDMLCMSVRDDIYIYREFFGIESTNDGAIGVIKTYITSPATGLIEVPGIEQNVLNITATNYALYDDFIVKPPFDCYVGYTDYFHNAFTYFREINGNIYAPSQLCVHPNGYFMFSVAQGDGRNDTFGGHSPDRPHVWWLVTPEGKFIDLIGMYNDKLKAAKEEGAYKDFDLVPRKGSYYEGIMFAGSGVL